MSFDASSVTGGAADIMDSTQGGAPADSSSGGGLLSALKGAAGGAAKDTSEPDTAQKMAQSLMARNQTRPVDVAQGMQQAPAMQPMQQEAHPIHSDTYAAFSKWMQQQMGQK